MLCQECNEDTVAVVTAKCSDMCTWTLSQEGRDEIIKEGSVPWDVGIGGGDYIEFSYCLSCKSIQDRGKEFPVNLTGLREED